MPIYQPNDVVRISTTFKVADVLTDPTAVTLTYRSPSGTSTTLTYGVDSALVKDTTGTYHADVTVSAAGRWDWRWVGTGTAAGVDEGTITVEGTLLGANLLCSVDDVKASLEITTTSNDDLIQGLISAASLTFGQRYQREFTETTGGTRYFGLRDRLLDLAPYDLRAVTSMTLHPEEVGQALTADADYVLLPQGGHPLGDTYQQVRFSRRLSFVSTVAREFGEARLRIVGDWGIFGAAPVSEDVRRAAVITVSSWLDRAVADYTTLIEDGREIRPDRTATWAIPYAAHTLLLPWARLGTP